MLLFHVSCDFLRAGLATTPGTVPTVHACVAYVRKIKFFKGCCNSKSKIHVTAGHSTVMATVQFFGWQEAQEQAKAAAQGSANEGESKGGVVVPRNWSPPVFDAGEEYCFQDALVTPKEGYVTVWNVKWNMSKWKREY